MNSDIKQKTFLLSKSNSDQSMGFYEWLFILVLSVFWGGSFFFIGVAVRELTPFSIVCGRVSLASVILLAYLYAKGEKMPLSREIWSSFFIMGFLNNVVPFSLIAWGQSHIESGVASILTATTPIFSVMLAHFLTKDEPLTLNRLTGVIIGWAGVAVLIGIQSLNSSGKIFYGQTAVLLAAFSYACAAVFGRRFKDMNPVVTATGMLCASTVMITPIALCIDKPWHFSPSVNTISALVALASVSTSLAYIIYFKVLASAGATNILLVTFLIPVSALILGIMFLAENPGWNAFVGMSLIFFGLIAIDGRLLKKRRGLITPGGNEPPAK